MAASILSLFLAAIIFIYFRSNSLKHSRWFLIRRFINWFPLGMTYAFMYMGRYNLNVAKNSLGALMTNQNIGDIFGVGAFVYAVSFLVNGPLVDKIGGKKGIIIGAVGASVANVVLGVLTYLLVTGRLHVRMVPAFAAVYGANMYFQSYGAVSIIKVKAYWFHVRERGTFGAIFGTLISLGVYFAFDWGQAIAEMAQANPRGKIGWLHHLIQRLFALDGSTVDATWALFYVPAAILLFWALMDGLLIKDTPHEAGFPPFDAADASSGHMHDVLTTAHLLKKVFASKMMLTVAFIGLTVGVLRNGIMNWYSIFAKESGQPGTEFFTKNWGFLICVFGILGGFAGGWVSDRFFHSRRGPPAAFSCGIMFVLTLVMAVFLFKSPEVVGWSAVLISMAVIAVHSLMAGTAAPDFGGRKATATCSGIVDGFVYMGSSLQSFGVGYLSAHGWVWWPLFLMPFALIGAILAISIWNALPAATRKYIAEHEEQIGNPIPGAPLDRIAETDA
ncbi:MAG TPA: MFS transporter [Candidatus Baltobacteraceae bacterium]|jgi:OPA family glycerol-3-phosphate transporter-like MFS transporter|nr:MFS transporter [Candidatus Baltobacteraceae bacterium]